jgi:hypothetical protein
MATQRSVSNVTSQYDEFLFAPIGDEPGGMRLSVISALARMNVDPWEEAARLSALSTTEAQRTLVSTLDLFPGKRQKSEETEILAARLVALLPKAREVTTAQAASTAGIGEQRTHYWIVWVCFAIAMSFLSSHKNAATPGAVDSASTSNTAPAAERGSARPAPADADSRPR